MRYTQKRFSQYRIMWIFVAFDLPTETKLERKAASGFRKYLLKDGFRMFQFSVYTRHCSSRENAKVHIKRVKHWIPENGKVAIFQMTDKQFSMAELFFQQKKQKPQSGPLQLTLF